MIEEIRHACGISPASKMAIAEIESDEDAADVAADAAPWIGELAAETAVESA